MKKMALIIALIAFLPVLSGCTEHSDAYYKTHPEALAKVMQTCTENPTERNDCDKLRKIAQNINLLMDELRENPQIFGQSIVKLQCELNKPIDKSKKEQLTQELAERLAVVRWLETPGGAR